jgi:hypothetical protein
MPELSRPSEAKEMQSEASSWRYPHYTWELTLFRRIREISLYCVMAIRNETILGKCKGEGARVTKGWAVETYCMSLLSAPEFLSSFSGCLYLQGKIYRYSFDRILGLDPNAV